MTIREPEPTLLIWNNDIWDLDFYHVEKEDQILFKEIFESHFNSIVDPLEKFEQMVRFRLDNTWSFQFCIKNKLLILDEFKIYYGDNPHIQINGIDATPLDSAGMWLYKNINLPIPYSGILVIRKDKYYPTTIVSLFRPDMSVFPAYKTSYKLTFESGRLTSHSQLKTKVTPSQILDTLKWLLPI